jgi:hypothetical protein
MIKIYGLMEGISFHSMFYTMRVNESHPKLFEIVNNIKNSKAGIESFGNDNHPRAKKGEIAVCGPKIYSDLYNGLKGNNNVILLDTEFEEFHKSLKKEFSKERLKIWLEKYKFDIKSQYYAQIIRTEVEALAIKKENPDFAFVGAAHAYDMFCNGEKDIFMEYPVNEEEVTKKVEEAQRYCDDSEMLEGALKSITLEYNLCPIGELSQEKIAVLKQTKNGSNKFRRLHGYIENLPYEKNPDFIGTWSLYKNNGLEGFFEMYIKEKSENHAKMDGKKVWDNISGVIKDSLGDSEFNGIINEKELHFEKKYKNIFDSDAVREIITYNGSHDNNGGYTGTFTYPNSMFKPLPFIICRYSPEMQKKIVNVNDISELIPQKEEENI